MLPALLTGVFLGCPGAADPGATGGADTAAASDTADSAGTADGADSGDTGDGSDTADSGGDPGDGCVPRGTPPVVLRTAFDQALLGSDLAVTPAAPGACPGLLSSAFSSLAMGPSPAYWFAEPPVRDGVPEVDADATFAFAEPTQHNSLGWRVATGTSGDALAVAAQTGAVGDSSTRAGAFLFDAATAGGDMTEQDASASVFGPDPALTDDRFWTDFGSAIALGDVTGNGVDDMLLGGFWVNDEREPEYAVWLARDIGLDHDTEFGASDRVFSDDLERGGGLGEVLLLADLDGDGLSDIGVADRVTSTNDPPRRVHVVFAPIDALPVDVPDVTIDASSLGEFSNFGDNLAAADGDGDGYPELAVLDTDDDDVYVFTAPLRDTTPDGAASRLSGDGVGFGEALLLSPAGEAGTGALFVSDPSTSEDSGGAIFRVASPFPPTLSIGETDVWYRAGTGENLAYSLASLGDVDDDGEPDLVASGYGDSGTLWFLYSSGL